MVFTGGKKRLMPIWATFDKVLLKNYFREYKDGKIKLFFDFEKELSIETDNSQFISEMKKDYLGLGGKVKRAQLRAIGIKVEMIE